MSFSTLVQTHMENRTQSWAVGVAKTVNTEIAHMRKKMRKQMDSSNIPFSEA